MSQRDFHPVLGVMLLIGLVVVLAAVIGTFVFGIGQDGGSAEAQTPTDPLEEANVERVVDDEAGVVCYVHDGQQPGADLSCLAMNETRLTPGGADS